MIAPVILVFFRPLKLLDQWSDAVAAHGSISGTGHGLPTQDVQLLVRKPVGSGDGVVDERIIVAGRRFF